jgi:hypothetical protein
MEGQREQVKRALLAEIEEMVDEVLEWEEGVSAPTLVEIEEVVLKLRRRVAQRVAEALLSRQEAARPVPGPLCPRCHQERRYKWSGEVTVESRLGPLRVKRGYFYCERCQSGLFPLGPTTPAMGSALE